MSKTKTTKVTSPRVISQRIGKFLESSLSKQPSRVLNLKHSNHNCKACELEYAKDYFSGNTLSNLYKLKDLLAQSRQCLYINVVHKELVDFLTKYTYVWSVTEIPIGYPGNNSIQYHIFINVTKSRMSIDKHIDNELAQITQEFLDILK